MSRQELATFMRELFDGRFDNSIDAYDKRTEAIEKRTEEIIQEFKEDRLEKRRLFKEILDRLNK